MNAPADIPQLLQEAHRRAIDDANRWRGQCVNQFARGEMAIGKALLVAEPGKKLPMLLSQKIEALCKKCPAETKRQKALVEFHELADQRNALVHGDGKVFIDQRGRWLLSLRSLSRMDVSTTTFLEDDASIFSERLQKVVQQLTSHFPA